MTIKTEHKAPITKLRIIFMGTPEFAVPTLETLISNHYHVVAVVTAPDKPAGRGLKLKISPVKECALKYNIAVLQPEKLKSPEFIEELKSFQADLQIVVAFRMLPEAIWAMPKLGTFNLHASLLPQYRGAAPINWAIINGEKQTGVSTFFLQHEIDTGDILFHEKESISEDDNAGTLYSRLMNKGAGLVLKTVRAIEKGEYKPQPQNFSKELKTAPKIHKETCEIDWNKSAEEVNNFVRGLSPYPAAWTKINEKNCKIFKTKIIQSMPGKKAGELSTDNKTFIHFNTGSGAVSVLELQLEGKKSMNIEEFLRGNKI
jgi:methionyl-tRNA formyltransferase